MNEYRGKHAPVHPWPVASSAAVSSRRGRHRKKSRRRVFFFIGLFLLLILMAWPFVEPKIYHVDSFEIRTNGLRFQENARPFRVVYLSDIHWGHWLSDWDLNRLVNQINNLYPDVIIFGGDYATDFDSAVRFFSQLQQKRYELHPRLRSFGVLGETDYIGDSFDLRRLRDAMSNARIQLLVNESVTFNTNAGTVCVAGADDFTSGSPDLKKLASSGDVINADYVIFAAHNPAVIPSAQLQKNINNSYEWFDLGLFGHTHGGQVPFLADWLDLSEDVPERYTQGTLFENRSWLIISRGIGTSSIPCRMFCPPQLHCIDIMPE